jgi:hypothetical protein
MMPAIVIAPAAEGRDKDIGSLVAVDGVDRVAVDIGQAVRADIRLAWATLGLGVGGCVGVAIGLGRRHAAAEQQSGGD